MDNFGVLLGAKRIEVERRLSTLSPELRKFTRALEYRVAGIAHLLTVKP